MKPAIFNLRGFIELVEYDEPQKTEKSKNTMYKHPVFITLVYRPVFFRIKVDIGYQTQYQIQQHCYE